TPFPYTTLFRSLEAIPDRHEDDFRALQGQGARWIGIRGVPTNHHPDFSEIGLEDRIIAARRNAVIRLVVGKVHFAVLANNFTFASDQHGRVVYCPSVLFV